MLASLRHLAKSAYALGLLRVLPDCVRHGTAYYAGTVPNTDHRADWFERLKQILDIHKRSTNGSYDPSSSRNPRDIESGSRRRDGIVVQVKEATEIRFDDFVPVGPVCSYDRPST